MKARFLPEAQEEFDAALHFYREIDHDLALEFSSRIEEGVEAICLRPQTYPFVERNVRRYLVSQFPYGIFYMHEEDPLTILGVMHLNRLPGYWSKRQP